LITSCLALKRNNVFFDVAAKGLKIFRRFTVVKTMT
jgi:hypothetical protein